MFKSHTLIKDRIDSYNLSNPAISLIYDPRYEKKKLKKKDIVLKADFHGSSFVGLAWDNVPTQLISPI